MGGFLAVFYLPVGTPRFDGAVLEAFHLVKWYAREHVLLCRIPALFIAGAISVFVSQGAVMKYLGPRATALALLLAGPALSLPSMLVLRSLMGLKKTVVYVTLVVVMSTIGGVLFGALA